MLVCLLIIRLVSIFLMFVWLLIIRLISILWMLVDQTDHLSEEHVEAALALHQRMTRHLVDEILRDSPKTQGWSAVVRWTLELKYLSESTSRPTLRSSMNSSSKIPVQSQFHESLLKLYLMGRKSEIPSSLLRKGNCFVKAFPGRLGTLIWTVLVTWIGFIQNGELHAWVGHWLGWFKKQKKRSFNCVKAKPHLSTIWTRSSASSQKLLSAEWIQYLRTRYKYCLLSSIQTLICVYLENGHVINDCESYLENRHVDICTLKTGMLVFISIRKSVNLVRPSPWVTGSFTLISR